MEEMADELEKAWGCERCAHSLFAKGSARRHGVRSGVKKADVQRLRCHSSNALPYGHLASLANAYAEIGSSKAKRSIRACVRFTSSGP